jgi:flagellar motility protein MotE (MotC chaperone)
MIKKKIKKDKEKKVDVMDKIIFIGFSLIIIVFIFIALFAMDVFKMKTKVVDEITKQLVNDQKNTASSYLGADIMRQYEEFIGMEFSKINAKEALVKKKTEEIEQREQYIEEKEKEYSLKKEELEAYEAKLYGDSKNIEELSKVVAKMTPENAAAMLSKIDDIDLVKTVIFIIKEDQSALILENLDPALAARIIMERYSTQTTQSAE